MLIAAPTAAAGAVRLAAVPLLANLRLQSLYLNTWWPLRLPCLMTDSESHLGQSTFIGVVNFAICHLHSVHTTY